MIKINRFSLPGLVEIVPKIHIDSRGSFKESFNLRDFTQNKLETNFVQENESVSSSGVFRGFHLQKTPFAQGKLVRAITGLALDIVIDLRKSSPTFQDIFSIILDPVLGNILYVPPGFAHAFLAIEDTVFSYKCTDFYNKDYESGVSVQSVEIDEILSKYGFNTKNIILSEKDKQLPTLEELLPEISGSQYS
jgi:dTDP-4-dehydrorhamnose 3,5-epimerase